MSRVTLMMPDLDRMLGADRVAMQQMLNISQALDTEGSLPEAFVKLTPGVEGHGEAWVHQPTGLVVIRADHRPVLLTSESCSLCGLKHMDVARTYLFGSPLDIQARAYSRYVDAHISLGNPTSG